MSLKVFCLIIDRNHCKRVAAVLELSGLVQAYLYRHIIQLLDKASKNEPSHPNINY